MGKYQVHQVDSNQPEIVEYLEAHGCTVESIGKPVDLAVGYRGRTFLFEVKQPKGKLRESQVKFINRWVGHVGVLRSIADAELFLAAQDHRKPAAIPQEKAGRY